MPAETPQTITEVWNQRKVPVILRRNGQGERLRARVPTRRNADGYRVAKSWIGACGKTKATWIYDEYYWEIPKSWFDTFVKRSLATFGAVYIIQPLNTREVCAPACRNATHFECECSCMGANHGMRNNDGWFDVHDAFSVRQGEKNLACRLVVRKGHDMANHRLL